MIPVGIKQQYPNIKIIIITCTLVMAGILNKYHNEMEMVLRVHNNARELHLFP